MNRIKVGVMAATLATCTVVVAAPKNNTEVKDIVDTAVAAGSFQTLAKALQAADLVDTLKGPGPFTVFAPTDEAFAKLPAGMLDELLKPENKEKLRAILTYLCIDDFTSRLNTLKSTLEDRGCEVWTAKNLADGQRIANCLDFEAIVVAQRLASLNPDPARGLAARPSLFLTYRGSSSPNVNRSLTPKFPFSGESVDGTMAFLPTLRRRAG